MSAHPSTFASKDEEIEYWKNLCKEVEQNYEEVLEQKRLAEEEFENEIMSMEEKALDYEIKFEQEKNEKLEIIAKSKEKHDQSVYTIAKLTDELSKTQDALEKSNKQRILLEQQNDDLERREREFSATIHDLQERIDQGTEKSVLVNLEYDELRNSSQEVVQRLKDEIRDQKQELHIKTMELEAVQRQMPKFSKKSNVMLTPNLSPIGFVDDMLLIVKQLEHYLMNGKPVNGDKIVNKSKGK